MIINVLKDLYWYTAVPGWSYKELLNPQGSSFTKLRKQVEIDFQNKNCYKTNCLALKKIKIFKVIPISVLALEYSVPFNKDDEKTYINHIFLIKLSKEQAENTETIPQDAARRLFAKLKPLYKFIYQKKLFRANQFIEEKMPALIKEFSLDQINLGPAPHKPNTKSFVGGNQATLERKLQVKWWFQQIL